MRGHLPEVSHPRSTYEFYRTLPYMTDIKEPINTTSDGTFLSVVCENPKKVCWPKVGGLWPAPPGITLLAETERGGRGGTKKKKNRKKLCTESNLGPLTLRDIGHYAYNLAQLNAPFQPIE